MTTKMKNDGGNCSAGVRNLLREAALHGAGGYIRAGARLAPHLADLVGGGAAQRADLAALDRIADTGCEDDVIAWFEQVLPGYIRLVPPARRRQFALGVCTAVNERPSRPGV